MASLRWCCWLWWVAIVTLRKVLLPRLPRNTVGAPAAGVEAGMADDAALAVVAERQRREV